MRRTLTLDPDVVRLLEDEAHRTGKPFKHVVNDAIRHALAARATPKPYKVNSHISKLAPGIDPTKFNALVDALEDAAVIAKMTRATRATRKSIK
jgi:hypothetical protein